MNGSNRSQFLYGIHPVAEALRAQRRQLFHAYLSKSSADKPRLQRLAALIARRGVPLDRLEKGRLTHLCESPEHQGIVLEAGPLPYTPFADLLHYRRLVLLDNMENPHNLGAILRTAEALGYDGVLLPRRGSPLVLPSVAKASAGACEHLRVAVNCSANQYVKIAMEEGWRVAALDRKGKTPLSELATAEFDRLLVAVGGEHRGVGQFILNQAHHVVSIEQRGRVNSLNASVAAGIALHALR